MDFFFYLLPFSLYVFKFIELCDISRNQKTEKEKVKIFMQQSKGF